MLDDKDPRRKTICLYCEQEFYFPMGDKPAKLDAYRRMVAHDAECSENPTVRQAHVTADALARTAAKLTTLVEAIAVFNMKYGSMCRGVGEYDHMLEVAGIEERAE